MKNFCKSFQDEYNMIFNDSGVLLVVVVAVFFYSVFYPVPYATEVLKNAPIAVMDFDQSVASRQLIRMIDATDGVAVQAGTKSLQKAKALFAQGEINGIYLVPEGFEKDLLRGKKSYVSTYSDASCFLLFKQVATAFTKATRTFSAGVEVKRLSASGMSRDRALMARDPLPLHSVQLYNPAGGYGSYLVPAVLLLVLQQTLLVGIGIGSGTRREENAGAMVVRPGWGESISTITGRALAYVSLYMIHAVFYFSVVMRFYDFPLRGRYLDIFLFVVPFLMAVVLFGMTLSSFFKRRESAIYVLLFSSLPFIFLSGISWPVECFPRWMRLASFLVPSTEGIDGLIRIVTMGAQISDVGNNLLCLWGLVALYFGCASLLFRRGKLF